MQRGRRRRWSSSGPPGCATTSARCDRAMEKQAVVLGDGTDADVVAFAEDQLEAAVQVFHVRGGRVRGQRGWVVEKVEDLDHRRPGRALLLQQVYGGEHGEAECRARCWCPSCPTDADALADWLSEHARQPGRPAGAAARRQAGPDGDGRAQRRQALTQHKTQARRRPDHPQPGAGGDRGGARPGPRRRCGSSATTSPTSRAPTSSRRWSSSRTGCPQERVPPVRGPRRRRAGRRRGDARGDHPPVPPLPRRARRDEPATSSSATAAAGDAERPAMPVRGIDPETGRAAQVRLPAAAAWWSTAAPPQVAAAARGARRARHRRRRAVRAGQAAGGGLAARARTYPVILPRTSEGALPAAAGPRRGAPVRDHLPPAAAVEAR